MKKVYYFHEDKYDQRQGFYSGIYACASCLLVLWQLTELRPLLARPPASHTLQTKNNFNSYLKVLSNGT
jgi:hypothetical protein